MVVKYLSVKFLHFLHVSEISLRETFERRGAAFCVSLCYVIVNNGFEGMRKGVGFSSIHASKCYFNRLKETTKKSVRMLDGVIGLRIGKLLNASPKTHPVYPVCNICTVCKVFNICSLTVI